VVTGVEYEEEEEGNGEVIVREVTARRLSQMGKEKRAAILEKARLKIIRYMTCAIELLQAGDWVITRDESDAEGELILRQIEEKFERTAYNLLFLTIRSSSGETQTLTTTNEHPVYVEGLGWIEAIDLEPGQEVLEPDGSKSTVIATRHERHLEGITVYNFRVNECHTYFVREQASQAEPVWVHNALCGPGRKMGVAENLSQQASRYQKQITGLSRGWAYVVNGVKFDGFRKGILLEAKGMGYASLLTKQDTRFGVAWRLIKQGQRQVRAFPGAAIEWHMAEKNAADITRQLFSDWGVDIRVVHTPMRF
jgi:hypothetical protein